MSEMSSLGIGSGVLTADIISQLKDNDNTLMVKPIEKKQDINVQKTQSLDLLSSLTSTLETSASTLKDDSLYQKRTVSGNTDDIEVSARDGVAIQSFSIADVSLAKKNVIQTGTFSSGETSTVASGNGTFNLNIDGSDYKIDYTDSMTYEELKTKINDVAGDKVTASILQISDDSYSLIITSDETGKDQQIGITDLSGNLDSELKSDILKSDSFDEKTTTVASSSGTFTLNAGGEDFTFDYDDTTTLEQMASMINDDENASKNLSASVIENNDGTYNLILTAKNQAENQSISITDNDSGLDTKLTDNATSDSGDVTDIQTSTDSSFKYNGITLTRSTNSIDDIQLGITISLLGENTNANISISQDTQPIKDEMENFVTAYNNLEKQLDSMTLADLDAGKVGLFNGDNSINSIGRGLRDLLTSRDFNTGQGLSQYGISTNRDGTISFNSSDFDDQIKKDPDGVADYFSGKTTVDTNGRISRKDGIFEKMHDFLKSLSSSSGSITTIHDGLSREATQLEDNRVKTLALLNSRYDSMTAQFIEYDAMINRMKNDFSSLQQQIEMSLNG